MIRPGAIEGLYRAAIPANSQGLALNRVHFHNLAVVTEVIGTAKCEFVGRGRPRVAPPIKRESAHDNAGRGNGPQVPSNGPKL